MKYVRGKGALITTIAMLGVMIYMMFPIGGAFAEDSFTARGMGRSVVDAMLHGRLGVAFRGGARNIADMDIPLSIPEERYDEVAETLLSVTHPPEEHPAQSEEAEETEQPETADETPDAAATEAPEQAEETASVEYEVIFLDRDGFALLTERVISGGLIAADVLAPEVEGYGFSHWVDMESGEVFAFDAPITRDARLIPAYEVLGGGVLEAGEAPEEEILTPDAASILAAGDATREVENTAAQITEIAETAGTPEPTGATVSARLETQGLLNMGDTFTLRAELSGYDAQAIQLQWQCFRDGAWHDIDGARDESLSLTLSQENIRCKWRVLVQY